MIVGAESACCCQSGAINTIDSKTWHDSSPIATTPLLVADDVGGAVVWKEEATGLEVAGASVGLMVGRLAVGNALGVEEGASEGKRDG